MPGTGRLGNHEDLPKVIFYYLSPLRKIQSLNLPKNSKGSISNYQEGKVFDKLFTNLCLVELCISFTYIWRIFKKFSGFLIFI